MDLFLFEADDIFPNPSGFRLGFFKTRPFLLNGFFWSAAHGFFIVQFRSRDGDIFFDAGAFLTKSGDFLRDIQKIADEEWAKRQSA